jgi:hypothetical protein
VVVKTDGFSDAMVDCQVTEGASAGRVDIPLTPLVRLRIRLVDLDGKPRAGLAFEIEIEGARTQGKTTSGGLIDVPIPADALDGTLRYSGVERPLLLGAMADAAEPAGAIPRLRNLALLGDEGATGAIDAFGRLALLRFQHKHQLPLSGTLDAATAARLKDRHGS